MKTILAPTDFSRIARNAIEYAVEISKRSHARLILFHVYQNPVVSAEAPVILPAEDIRKSALKSLESLRKRILAKHGNKLKIECKVSGGFTKEEISACAKKENADLVIMGMAGAGYIKERYIGSTTTSVIKHATFPVIAVDKQVKFKSIKKILLACDYEETENKLVLGPLKDLANMFKSHIYILNVVPDPASIPTVTKAVAGLRLERSLEDTRHSFHFVENEDVAEGINQFAEKNKMDMVAMIPRKHSVFRNIFRERNSKRLAFHTKLPLLSLHE